MNPLAALALAQRAGFVVLGEGKDRDRLGSTIAEEFVAHYTTAEKAIRYVLRDRQLRLRRFKETNDPWEPRSLERFRTRDVAQAGARLTAQDRQRSSPFFASFASGPVEALRKDHELRVWEADRMWAQYADNHTGVCLLFRKTSLVVAAQESLPAFDVRAESVRYGDAWELPPVNLDREGDTSSIDPELINHYFYKRSDWRDEREFRIIALPPDDPSDDFLFVAIGPPVLAGVLAGHCTDLADLRELQRLCDELACPLARVWYGEDVGLRPCDLAEAPKSENRLGPWGDLGQAANANFRRRELFRTKAELSG